jgi:hypothetical protein
MREKAMTFACLGYIGESIGDAMSKSEQNAGVEECFAYDDILREKEYWPVFDSVGHARFIG